MVQYEMYFTNEYVEEIIHEIANIMKADVNEKDAAAIKAIMLKWDNLIREEYGQELTDNICNVYGKKNTVLNNIEEYYGKKIF